MLLVAGGADGLPADWGCGNVQNSEIADAEEKREAEVPEKEQ